MKLDRYFLWCPWEKIVNRKISLWMALSWKSMEQMLKALSDMSGEIWNPARMHVVWTYLWRWLVKRSSSVLFFSGNLCTRAWIALTLYFWSSCSVEKRMANGVWGINDTFGLNAVEITSDCLYQTPSGLWVWREAFLLAALMNSLCSLYVSNGSARHLHTH